MKDEPSLIFYKKSKGIGRIEKREGLYSVQKMDDFTLPTHISVNTSFTLIIKSPEGKYPPAYAVTAVS